MQIQKQIYESSELYLQTFMALEGKFVTVMGLNRENTEREQIYLPPFGIQVATFSTKILFPV